MNLGQAVKMAAKSISSNKGRSALTMLGIIIGLAAVIILVSYAKGQNMAMAAYYESMGTNQISVYASTWGNSGAVDVGQELYDYCLNLDGVLGISPNGSVWDRPTIKYESKTLSRESSRSYAGGGASVTSYNNSDDYPQIYLGNDKFGLCSGYTISKGRDLSYLDIENLNQVCVLGSATAEYLFSFANPVDKTITINGRPFRVVGVYQSKAAGKELGGGEDAAWMQDSINRMDRMILLPSTMTRYFNNNQPIEEYVVKAKDSDSVKKVTTSLNGFLSGLINTNYGSYGVYPVDTWAKESTEANAMQQRFLGGIAAISLLVGGIGIMNIMLVTVTERTREIGIRKAIGAERKSIIAQFLIEAAMICSIGGLIGIAIGYVGTMVAGKLLLSTTTDVLLPSPIITLGAFLFSVALGVIFGMYPAVKASGLQPVVALRAE